MRCLRQAAIGGDETRHKSFAVSANGASRAIECRMRVSICGGAMRFAELPFAIRRIQWRNKESLRDFIVHCRQDGEFSLC